MLGGKRVDQGGRGMSVEENVELSIVMCRRGWKCLKDMNCSAVEASV